MELSGKAPLSSIPSTPNPTKKKAIEKHGKNFRSSLTSAHSLTNTFKGPVGSRIFTSCLTLFLQEPYEVGLSV